GLILGGVNRISDEFLNEIQQKIEGVEEELQVVSVSAINANTILVTFEGIEEPVEIELEEALVHGQTEVTFVYNEVEYTAELTEAYVDPEVEAEEKLAAAITAAEEAIAALPTVEEVAIEDAQAVADAKALVEAVKALDAEAVVEGEEVIAELEAKIEELEAEQAEQEKAEAIKNAIDKINAIGKPATLTLEDEAKVVAARTAVNAAKELGAVDADIVNLDQLIAAETQINALKEALNEKETAIQEANVALTNLPLEVTLEDKEQVEEARELVNKALELGAEENDFVNLWKLTDAEAKIAELEEEAAEAEAVQAVIEAIDALPEEITLEDAEAVADARAAYDALTEEQQELVTNVDVLEAAEAKIAELEEEAAKKLKVESVSAISQFGVTIEFEAIEEAMEGVTVEVIDNNGNVREVKPVDLVEGETLATFDFVTPLGSQPDEGVWTVNGVPYDFDFLALLADVNGANDELELYNALIAIGAENVLSKNATEYDLQNPKDFTSLEEIQKFVDEVNQAQVEQGDFDEWKDALEDTFNAGAIGNKVEFLNALDRFERVNADYATQYNTALNTAGSLNVALTNFEEVQEAIDGVNLAQANTAVNTTAKAPGADRDAYNDAVKAVSFVAPDEEDDDTKATLEEELVILDKVLRVFEATTPAQLTVAYNNLVSTVDDTDVIGDEPFYAAARDFYLAELNPASPAPALARTIVAVDGAIVAGNAAAQFAALGDIDAIVATAGPTQTSIADVLKALQALDAVTEKDDFNIADVKTDKASLEAYRAALAALNGNWTGGALSAGNEAADIVLVEQAIDGVNNPSGIAVLDNVFEILPSGSGTTAATADELWDGTSDSANQGLDNLPEHFNAIEANKVAYFANIAQFDTVLDGSADAAQEAKAKELIAAINSLEELRAAKTATDARAALSALAFNAHVTDELTVVTTNYINLSSAQKLEAAEYVMDQTVTNVLATEVAAIFAATTGYVDLYKELIDDVNGAGPATGNLNSISAMSAALGAIGYDAFDDLTAQEKMDVAEVVLNSIPYNAEKDVQVDFKLLSEIRAAIDAAIAELGL
ncbi:MAG: hypothetical protein ACOYCB_13385, partial [Fastidiosipilaceae bacterium]